MSRSFELGTTVVKVKWESTSQMLKVWASTVDSVEGVRLPHGHPVTVAVVYGTVWTSPIYSCTTHFVVSIFWIDHPF